MENVHLKQFEADDKDAVYALHIAGLKQTDSLIGGEARKTLDKDLEDVQKTYLENRGAFFVVTHDSQIIGMGGLKNVDENTAEIKRMRVQISLQGKGIGKLILDKLIEQAKDFGYTKLILHTSVTQTAAHHLYESRGFKVYKRGDVYGQETIYYQKDLG